MIYWRKNLLHIKLWWSTCLISSNTVSYKTLIQFKVFVFFSLKDKHTEPWSIEIHVWNWIVYCLLSPVITTSGYASRICRATAHWSLMWWNFMAPTHCYQRWQRWGALHPWIRDGTRRDTSSKILIRDFPGGSVVKHRPAGARDVGSIPSLGRSHNKEKEVHK